MSAQPNGSRWRHFRASLSRQSRGRGKDTIAIIGLAVLAIVMTLYIFTQQKASIPSWAPVVGEDFAHLKAEFTSAQAVTPGQGQAVVIAGVQIGKITSADLENGHALVGMDVEPKYLKVIHPDATLLLRPKTNLNDMTIEIDPGSAPGHVQEGYTFPLSRTEPNVNLEALLSTLDTDTRQYLQLLVAGGAEGIGGRGRQLAGAFRRLQPFAHYNAKLNRVLAERREAIADSIHLFNQLTTELARHDDEIERFVTSSKDALGNFANQQQALQETLVEFPPTLAALQRTAAAGNRFSLAARPALLGLIPQAQALGPAFSASEKLFRETTAPIRDQIRPFTRQIRPVLKTTARGASDFNKTVRGFGNSLGAFNSFLNEFAYDPPGAKQSFLFYAPWGLHDLNASYLQDAGGPIQRSLVLVTCNGTSLAYSIAATKPYLKTTLETIRVPRRGELPQLPADPTKFQQNLDTGQPTCGPGSEE
jgi:phospholipid/cholesterol/gamma-HCH transport system substrate-binding protein